MSHSVDVAVVGATGVVGEVMLELLEQREFPVGSLYPLASASSAGKRVEFRGQSLVVRDLAGFDFTQVGLALFCDDKQTAAEYVPRANDAGCVVIDNSECFRGEADVSLVIPEVNPDAIAEYRERRIIACPDALTVQLWVALKPLHDVARIERINLATYQAVSDSGRAGIKELAGQTANLLNARPIEQQVYDKQIAFNALARMGSLEENGYTRVEMNLVRESHKLLAEQELAINPTAVQVPVFYAHGMAVHLETRDKLTAEQARSLLEAAPGVSVMDDSSADGFPTAVTDAANQDQVLVGRVREDISHSRALDLWIVADNVRRGAALNSVQIAEILVKDYL